MAKRLKFLVFAAVLLLLTLVFSGCGDELAELSISADTYSYAPGVNLFDVLPEDETTAVPETTAVQDDVETTVYWVTGGEVWHLKRECSTLSRSKNISSGTVEEAMTAGKARVCKRCGG